MLFDLGGKRKRVVQVVYATLALLMGGGLVLLGIGGDASGGLLDAVGLGSNSSSSDDPAFESQIDRAEEALAADPEDEKALLTLARLNFQAGNASIETDETGERVLTEESLASYEAALDAWQDYLAANPKPPDDTVASLMNQVYANTWASSASISELNERVEGGLEAARIVAEARPSFGTLTTFGEWAYRSGDSELGDQAREDALKEASDSTSRQQANQLLDQAELEAKAIAQASKRGATSPEQLEDPLGGLGGSSSSAPPGSGG